MRRTATGVVAYLLVNEREHVFLETLTYFQHLDKGDAQVKVCQVSEHQTQAERRPDRDNCSEVYPASHLNFFTSVE